MTLFDSPAFDGHEEVATFHDRETGLKAIVAIHSTARGPAVGGCRMWKYPDAEAALTDALRLSRAMSYKSAIAGLDLGGGKAIILGDKVGGKLPGLFEALGRAVHSLGGRYWTADDVGVTPGDMAQVRSVTPYVVGLSGHVASSGDPSPAAAEGVFRAMQVAVRRRLDKDLDQTSVAIQGLGAVGGRLAEKLAAAGARLVVCDLDAAKATAFAQRTGAKAVKPEAIFDADADVFAPCALGGALNDSSVPRLKARVVVGGANNQLSHAGVGQYLFDKEVLYAPDYVVNAGALISVAGEIAALKQDAPFDPIWVEARLAGMVSTLEEVLDRSASERRPPSAVADDIARGRIDAARN